MNITEVNLEINRLQKIKDDLQKCEIQAKEDYIKSLEWTKDCHARLETNNIIAAGLPSYKILIYGKSPMPHSIYQSINVMGDSKHYQENVMYGRDYSHDSFCFYTNSYEILIKFMKKVKFRSFEYDKKLLEILETARQISELT